MDGRAKAERILLLLEDELGTPTLEVSDDPLGELVATILSQNTTDRNSERAFASLRERFPAWRDVRDAPVEEIADAIRYGGLAEIKARRIQAILRALSDGGGRPSLDEIREQDDDTAVARLSEFEGVGAKTAACVLLFGLGRDVFPVDTHVHHVCNRLGLVRTRAPDATHEAMKPIVPSGKAYRLHVSLVRFGRRFCHARRPRCHACPLFDVCSYEERHEIAAVERARNATTTRVGDRKANG